MTYVVLLVLSLQLNGIAIAGRTPIRTLLAPLRDRPLVVRLILLDIAVVPLLVLGTATLLDVGTVGYAGLVIIAASSCGPIGIALSRIARGDVALSVTLVLGLGALNILTVPLVTGLLLPQSITIPLGSLLSTLVGLAVIPLILGRVVAAVSAWRQVAPQRLDRRLTIAGRASDLLLAGAVVTAFLLDASAIVEILAGPVMVVALVTMAGIALSARLASPDPARRRTIALSVNARAVGLALTLATIHLGDVEGLRATILAYGGLTQLVPILVALGVRRTSGRSRSDAASAA